MAIFLPPWLLQRGFIITKTIQTIMLRTFNLFMPGKWVLWEGNFPSSPSPSLLFLFSPHRRMPRRSILYMLLRFLSFLSDLLFSLFFTFKIWKIRKNKISNSFSLCSISMRGHDPHSPLLYACLAPPRHRAETHTFVCP